MFISATPEQSEAILRAMMDVARTRGADAVTEADRASVKAAADFIFDHRLAGDVRGLAPISGTELAAALPDEDLAEHATQFLAVMAVVDGTVDEGKVGQVLSLAAALGVHEDYLRELTEAARHELEQVAACMLRLNRASVSGRPEQADETPADYFDWIMPYRDGNADPALVARFEALGELAPGTFGRNYWQFYKSNGFAFSGDPNAPSIAFTVPHDSTHVLSGYSTTPQGELLVSTYTGGMHPDEPLAGHILPAIFSWHLGIELTRFAGSLTGALQPEKFFAAWSRGGEMTVDTFAPDWDFWGVVEETVDNLREEYHVPPLDPRLAAETTQPSWYHPSP